MGLERVYREAMAVNTIEDMKQRESAATAFFEPLNQTELPDRNCAPRLVREPL